MRGDVRHNVKPVFAVTSLGGGDGDAFGVFLSHPNYIFRVCMDTCYAALARESSFWLAKTKNAVERDFLKFHLEPMMRIRIQSTNDFISRVDIKGSAFLIKIMQVIFLAHIEDAPARLLFRSYFRSSLHEIVCRQMHNLACPNQVSSYSLAHTLHWAEFIIKLGSCLYR